MWEGKEALCPLSVGLPCLYAGCNETGKKDTYFTSNERDWESACSSFVVVVRHPLYLPARDDLYASLCWWGLLKCCLSYFSWWCQGIVLSWKMALDEYLTGWENAGKCISLVDLVVACTVTTPKYIDPCLQGMYIRVQNQKDFLLTPKELLFVASDGLWDRRDFCLYT